MIVYVILCGHEYEESDVDSVWSTKHKAENQQEKIRKSEENLYDCVEVLPFSVDKKDTT